MPDLKQLLTCTNIAILIFVIYFIAGMLIYRDYGISTDEGVERMTSLVNYVHVMGRFMATSDSEHVQHILQNTSPLTEWFDRYYGVALQTLTVIIEHMRGFEMTYREIFLMRHAFTFINYFAAAVFFYLILRRRYSDNFMPVVGLLFFILYPRFFGESFYNIKDILFYSWCVIASYFTLRWLEDERKSKFIIPAAITIAIATNTRILGVSILLLACGFAFLQGIMATRMLKRNMIKCGLLILLTFVSYVIITPFTWENPVRNTINIFIHFVRFQPWDFTHFYMGEMITRYIPWHYIPVWMGITVPLLYIAMFFAGFIVLSTASFKIGLQVLSQKLNMSLRFINSLKPVLKDRFHMYDFFFFAMFSFTLFGFILLRITMYEGWRHAYSIFLPFLYVAVYGLYRVFAYLNHSRRTARNGLISAVSAYMLYLLVWIIISHPYQYVYFNLIGRQVAEQNFTLDYWYVSKSDLLRYALNSSDEPFITIALDTGGHPSIIMLTEDEQERMAVAASLNTADYFIRGSRVSYEWQTQHLDPDFSLISAIIVDGMRIASLYRRNMPFSFIVDSDAWDKIVQVDSNVYDGLHYLNDGDMSTWWTTGKPQLSGDYLMFEFSEAVDFNYIHLNPGHASTDYPLWLTISTSTDGVTWQTAPVQTFVAHRHYVFESDEYNFLKLQIMLFCHFNNWSVADISFGHVNQIYTDSN